MRLLDTVMPKDMNTVFILCGVIVGLVIINALLVLYLRRKNKKNLKNDQTLPKDDKEDN